MWVDSSIKALETATVQISLISQWIECNAREGKAVRWRVVFQNVFHTLLNFRRFAFEWRERERDTERAFLSFSRIQYALTITR